jgi:hypothetical protein
MRYTLHHLFTPFAALTLASLCTLACGPLVGFDTFDGPLPGTSPNPTANPLDPTEGGTTGGTTDTGPDPDTATTTDPTTAGDLDACAIEIVYLALDSETQRPWVRAHYSCTPSVLLSELSLWQVMHNGELSPGAIIPLSQDYPVPITNDCVIMMWGGTWKDAEWTLLREGQTVVDFTDVSDYVPGSHTPALSCDMGWCVAPLPEHQPTCGIQP